MGEGKREGEDNGGEQRKLYSSIKSIKKRMLLYHAYNTGESTHNHNGLPYKHTSIFPMFCHPKSECSLGITFFILTTDFHGLVSLPNSNSFFVLFLSEGSRLIGSYFVTPLIVSSLVSYSYLRFWHK